jgi:hypothetical protein
VAEARSVDVLVDCNPESHFLLEVLFLDHVEQGAEEKDVAVLESVDADFKVRGQLQSVQKLVIVLDSHTVFDAYFERAPLAQQL